MSMPKVIGLYVLIMPEISGLNAICIPEASDVSVSSMRWFVSSYCSCLTLLSFNFCFHFFYLPAQCD